MFIGYGIMFCVAVGVIAVLVMDRRRLVRLIRRYLPPYEATGLVSPDDIVMLASLRTRARARNWARATAGLATGKAMADYQLAATELALLHSKAATGVVTATEFLDRQHDLVGLMHVARDAFMARSASLAWPAAPAPRRRGPPRAAQASLTGQPDRLISRRTRLSVRGPAADPGSRSRVDR